LTFVVSINYTVVFVLVGRRTVSGRTHVFIQLNVTDSTSVYCKSRSPLLNRLNLTSSQRTRTSWRPERRDDGKQFYCQRVNAGCRNRRLHEQRNEATKTNCAEV